MTDHLDELFTQGPEVRALCLELHAQLAAALSAFDDEEDSVKSEHRHLMQSMRTLIAKSDCTLKLGGAMDSDSDRAKTLRKQAEALLCQAIALDELRPFVVTHTHEYGSTIYVMWSGTTPTEEDAEAILESEYEPEKGEQIEINDTLNLSDLTGSCSQPESVTEIDEQTETLRP